MLANYGIENSHTLALVEGGEAKITVVRAQLSPR